MLDQSRRDELSEELGNDFLAELTDVFWADAWSLLDFGVKALVEENVPEMRKILHTLAGSASNLGLTAIVEAANAANTALKLGERPDLGHMQAVMLRTSALLPARRQGHDRRPSPPNTLATQKAGVTSSTPKPRS